MRSFLMTVAFLAFGSVAWAGSFECAQSVMKFDQAAKAEAGKANPGWGAVQVANKICAEHVYATDIFGLHLDPEAVSYQSEQFKSKCGQATNGRVGASYMMRRMRCELEIYRTMIIENRMSDKLTFIR